MVISMILSNAGLGFLKAREGYDPKCRLENGSWKAHYDKIGNCYDMPFGICYDLDGSAVRKDSIWTNEKVNHVFKTMCARYENKLNEILQGVELTQCQFDALFSFSWNIGINGFRGSTALKDLKAGRLDRLPSDMLMWTKNKELIPRRKLEVKLFSEGVYD